MPILSGLAFHSRWGRFFFALLSLSRFSVTLGFFDRPLLAGLICSLCLGDFSLATSCIMPVAIFYEILWIDLFPAGTYVPPNGTLSFFLVMCMAYFIGSIDENIAMSTVSEGTSLKSTMHALSPTTLLFPMILAMPAADWASRVETFLRHRSDGRYDRLVSWLGRGQGEGAFPLAYGPQSLIGAALVQSLVIYMVMFLLCFFVLFVTFWCVELLLGHFPQQYALFHDSARGTLTWPMFWFAALVGALLALRIKKAYIAYGTTVCVLFLSFFFTK